MDNVFARNFIGTHGDLDMAHRRPKSSKLCSACRKRNLLESGFSMQLEGSKLERTSSQCDLCRLLLRVWNKHKTGLGSILSVERRESTLTLTDGREFPIFSIFSFPGKFTHILFVPQRAI